MRRENRTAPRWWRTYVLDVIAETEASSDRHRESDPVGRSLGKVAVVIVAAALSLTVIRYARTPDFIETLAGTFGSSGLGDFFGDLANSMTQGADAAFNRLVWWAVVSIVGYTVIPVVAILILGERLRDYGAAAPASWRSGRPYFLLFALSVPVIVAASFFPAFQTSYPFYEPTSGQPWWPRVAVFWALYIAQFVAVEFFFRGFMIFGLAPRLGIAAVFVMVIPYSMIHFTKPLAETLSSIVGGTVLGFLSLKTNTFWWAAAIHIGVAMTMELASLWQIGFF